MKLRNKKTGEIVEFFNNTSGILPCSLAELWLEWEDYEEPETFWYINDCGDVLEYTYKGGCYAPVLEAEEIGNRFETQEEGKRAVEKLKAITRLKNRGLKFCGYEIHDDYLVIKTNFHIPLIGEELDLNADDSCETDLDILFGGEE